MAVYTRLTTPGSGPGNAVPHPTGTHALQTTSIPATLADLVGEAHLDRDLAGVEELLNARTASQLASFSAAARHIINSGGKRLRAALALLAARLGQYDFKRAIHPAAAVELIHTASLIHDDLVDQAALRRGRATVHALWDNDVALMLGDYFFALAAAEMALSPDPRIITFYAQAVQTIVEGELSPVTMVAPLEQAREQYNFKTGSKTAALFEAACKAGMVAGYGSDEQISALGSYGYNLGMAFQIVDDVLDFTGDEQLLGKPVGNDLLQGTITLPLIYAAAQGSNKLLHSFATAEALTPATLRALIDEVLASGGIDRAMEDARSYANRAIGALAGFADAPAHTILCKLARFVVERQS